MEDAAKNGITRLLSNAMDYATSVDTIALAKRFGGTVLAAIGLHPWSVVNSPTIDLTKFERLLDENREHVKAIGEIGLDGKYTQDTEKRNKQREVFQFFLAIAEKKRLPVVIHSRLAVDEVLNELSRFTQLKVLLHWYDGPVEKLKSIRERGYMISIGPALFYSKRIAEITRKADLGMILSETDGPVTYHGPFQGKFTQPSFVIDVVRRLAEMRSENVETVREAVWSNFQKYTLP
jgi:TatD DNase family protein